MSISKQFTNVKNRLRRKISILSKCTFVFVKYLEGRMDDDHL